MGQTKKAALYLRVSSADQSCERQERDLVVYAEKLGYEVVGIFRETASGVRVNRAERAKVIKLAQKRHIDAILVTELSRWGRSTVDLIGTLQQLQSWGVSLLPQTGFQLDMSTATGKLMAQLLASVAEFERDLLRERVISGIANRRARGGTVGRVAGHDYKVEKVKSEVKKLRQAGLTIRAIASELGISKTTVEKAMKAA